MRTVNVGSKVYEIPEEATQEQVDAFVEKNTPYGYKILKPLTDFPGKVKENYEKSAEAPVTPGVEILAAIGRAGGVLASTLGEAVAAPLGAIDQVLLGIPGKTIGLVGQGYQKLGEWEKYPFTKLGKGIAKTEFGKSLYKFGTDPEQAENLRALGNVSSLLPIQGIARVLGKPISSIKSVEKLSKTPGAQKVAGNLPKAYETQLGKTTSEQIQHVSKLLNDYDMGKYVDPFKPDPVGLENHARDMYLQAVEKADNALIQSGAMEPVDIMRVVREAVSDEINKGTKGLFSEENASQMIKRAAELEKAYGKEWSGELNVMKALDFKRNVLNKDKNLMSKSIVPTYTEKADNAIKKIIYHKLNDKLAEISPEFKEFNKVAQDMKAIQEASEGLKIPTRKSYIGSIAGGTVMGGAGAAIGSQLGGAGGAVIGSAIGSPIGAYLGSRAPGDVLKAFTSDLPGKGALRSLGEFGSINKPAPIISPTERLAVGSSRSTYVRPKGTGESITLSSLMSHKRMSPAELKNLEKKYSELNKRRP